MRLIFNSKFKLRDNKNCLKTNNGHTKYVSGPDSSLSTDILQQRAPVSLRFVPATEQALTIELVKEVRTLNAVRRQGI